MTNDHKKTPVNLPLDIRAVFAACGRRGGSARSTRKTLAARRNARRGGRPPLAGRRNATASIAWRIVRAYARGVARRELAAKYNVHYRTICRLVAHASGNPDGDESRDAKTTHSPSRRRTGQ